MEKTQKFLGYIGLVLFGLMAVYAFGMATPAACCFYYEATTSFYKGVQSINNGILVLSIVGLLLSAFYAIFRSSIRKIYYLANFIENGLLGVMSLVGAIYLFVGVGSYQSQYGRLDFAAMNAYWISHSSTTRIDPNTPVFALGYVLGAFLTVYALTVIALTVVKGVKRIAYEKKHRAVTVAPKENSHE
jgi:hypothetical protein